MTQFPQGNFRCFTLNCSATEGIAISQLSVGNPPMKIPAIVFAEGGRGRKQGVCPVNLLSENYLGWQEYYKKPENLSRYPAEPKHILHTAYVGQTKSGLPKLFEADVNCQDGYVIILCTTKIGFRGCNYHSGDRTAEWTAENPKYIEWPGFNIADGRIAESMAGRAGSGEQYLTVMPKDVVFRTGYGGRLYGNSPAHYHIFDGKKIISATQEDRCAADLF